MHTRRWLTKLGIVFFIFGVAFGLYLLAAGFKASVDAIFQSITSHLGPVPLPLSWLETDVKCPMILSEKESAIVSIVLSNLSTNTANISVNLFAPTFTVSPLEPREVTILPNAIVELSWVVAPNNMGNQIIMFSINNFDKSEVCGIAITNILGLTAKQAELLSLASSILGSSLSIPWMYERWQQHQKKRKQAQKSKRTKKLKSKEVATDEQRSQGFKEN